MLLRSVQKLFCLGILCFLATTAPPLAAAFPAFNASNAASHAPNGTAILEFGVGCGSSVEYTSLSQASDGQPAFSKVIENPLATFISLHFTEFNLPPRDYIVVRPVTPDESESRSFIFHGDETDRDFFSNALFTKAIVLELYTSGDTAPFNPSKCMGFRVDSYQYAAASASVLGSAEEVICGDDNSQEAPCLRPFSRVFESTKPVIRLLVHKGSAGSFFCTGWLVGCEGHVLTNHHCISEDAHARNTEFEFNAQGSSCSSNCRRAFGCRGQIRTRTATLITASYSFDYALVKLPIDLSNEYGYLRMRESGARQGERVYIPQHPSGWGKRVAMKTDDGDGVVTSLRHNGCRGSRNNRVSYFLDTRGGSSGSPVLSSSDHSVVAIHHCGGCPNSAVNIRDVVSDLKSKNLLPRCALFEPPTPAPTPRPTTQAPRPPPTRAPTPPPTPPPTRSPTRVSVDGTIFSTATRTSVDYVDFTLTENAEVELDILSMETKDGNQFVDVNGDCNAAYLDTSMALFRLTNSGISESTIIALNNDAPPGYGSDDGSISSSDSYMYLPLPAGRYRLAVGAAPLSIAQAVDKGTPVSTSPRICNHPRSNYGSYRLTVVSSSAVHVTPPGSYIGSQCAASNVVTPYHECNYHKEATLTRAVVADGTIVRGTSSVSVDHIPFSVSAFGRVVIEVSSHESKDGYTFVDVNGNCASGYIDPVAYLFRRSNSNGELSITDLLTARDDDENFAVRDNRRSVSFRDPYLTMQLPKGEYVLVVGRYPLNVNDAMSKSSSKFADRLTPESCGAKSNTGNYMVTFGSPHPLTVTSPNTFIGSKCSANIGKVLCYAN